MLVTGSCKAKILLSQVKAIDSQFGEERTDFNRQSGKTPHYFLNHLAEDIIGGLANMRHKSVLVQAFSYLARTGTAITCMNVDKPLCGFHKPILPFQ